MTTTRATLRAYCLSKNEAIEDFPFGDDVAVFKVMGKIFALLPLAEQPPSISLKCEPMLAQLLRQTYPSVVPGYHLNKRLWNTITVDGTMPEDELFELIDHSYEQVAKGLTKSQRGQLGLA
jgi:predicted DNA-binding protein (MmcQ/YjbR family)